MEDINTTGYVIFSEGYDENENPIHKQEFITYKEKCEELIKLNKELKDENKSLKSQLTNLKNIHKNDKWSKLKEFVKNTNVGSYAYKCNILDKMKELEQGE